MDTNPAQLILTLIGLTLIVLGVYNYLFLSGTGAVLLNFGPITTMVLGSIIAFFGMMLPVFNAKFGRDEYCMSPLIIVILIAMVWYYGNLTSLVVLP